LNTPALVAQLMAEGKYADVVSVCVERKPARPVVRKSCAIAACVTGQQAVAKTFFEKLNAKQRRDVAAECARKGGSGGGGAGSAEPPPPPPPPPATKSKGGTKK
jgi:hypothetical protein